MPQDSPEATTSSDQFPELDTGVANAARMWNYWIGGKDNFRADRDAGDHVLAAMPALPFVARAMARSYNATSELTITPRDRATVARFFDGLEMTGQGLLPIAQWWGSSPATTSDSNLICYCGIARKP